MEYKTNYDVIIVGAGPSGSSCAYNIKRLNPTISILLLDQYSFPRYKPCGGGISPEVVNYLDFDLSPAIDSICSTVCMVANNKNIESDRYPLWMVRREVFDHYLVQQAQMRDVEFLENTIAHHVTSDDNSICVETNKGIFFAKYLVLAEGSKGKLAKKLGIAPKNTILGALEYEHYTKQKDGKLYIDFDYNETGYAWNFPKSDGLSCGICGVAKNKQPQGLPNKIREYMQQFSDLKLDKQHLHGHPIQVYNRHKTLVHNRVILIGEIAGCADPLTAEGIRPAIKSAYLAAQAIAKSALSGKVSDLKTYNHLFYRHIGKDMNKARLFSLILNRHMKVVVPHISNKRAIDGFMSVFSGESTYADQVTIRRFIKLARQGLKNIGHKVKSSCIN